MNEIGCVLTFLGPFSCFRPIGNNVSEKFKGVPNFLGDEIQNSVFAVCAPCRPLHVCKISGRLVERAASKILLVEVSHCSEWPQVKRLQQSRYIILLYTRRDRSRTYATPEAIPTSRNAMRPSTDREGRNRKWK